MPKSDKEHDEEWTSLYKEYKESIKNDEENATKKLNKEIDDFVKMWVASGGDVYDKFGRLIPGCKKALKKEN